MTFCSPPRQKRYVCQQADWPAFSVNDALLASELHTARIEQGRLLGQLEATGLQMMQDISRELWVEDALAHVRQKKTLARLPDAGSGGFLGGMTTDKLSKMNNISKPIATRDLTQLNASGLLVATGVGKGTRYAANVVGWNQSS